MVLTRFSLLALIWLISACIVPFAPPTSALVPTLEQPPVGPPQVRPTTPLLPEAPSVGPPITPTPNSAIDDLPSSPLDAISISQPGLLSEVVSPVKVAGVADTTFEQNLILQVTDENGDILTIQPISIQADMGKRGPFAAQVDFTVSTDQPGRISVFNIDARDGSLVHLSSVDVTLLASGDANIQPPRAADEVIQIASPKFQAEVSGGTLVVEGFSEYFFEANLGIAICADGTDSDISNFLCGTANNVFEKSFAMIAAPEMGQPGPFHGEVLFSVDNPTIARVVVYATSPRDGGLLHASSILVTLLP